MGPLTTIVNASAGVVDFSTVDTVVAIQAAVDRYLQSLRIYQTLASPTETYTMKLRLVSCLPTTKINSLLQQQASRNNQFFLILRRLVMNIKIQLVYLR